ncbi:MAG: arginine repressor, partial [Lachnospiraceae bacterium]|nr:arginine repressor [Lachnospiraceae bacterium]
TDRYMDTFRAGYVSMAQAQNILVIRTVSGMASGVAAALDAMNFKEIVGTIAGDDTIMCAIGSVEETTRLMEKIQALI